MPKLSEHQPLVHATAEISETTLGRYLEPGDVVELEVERLGVLRTPIVARPGAGNVEAGSPQ